MEFGGDNPDHIPITTSDHFRSLGFAQEIPLLFDCVTDSALKYTCIPLN